MFGNVLRKLRSIVEIDVVNGRGEETGGGDGEVFRYVRPALRIGVAVRDALGDGVDYTDFDSRFPFMAAWLLFAATVIVNKFGR